MSERRPTPDDPRRLAVALGVACTCLLLATTIAGMWFVWSIFSGFDMG